MSCTWQWVTREGKLSEVCASISLNFVCESKKYMYLLTKIIQKYFLQVVLFFLLCEYNVLNKDQIFYFCFVLICLIIDFDYESFSAQWFKWISNIYLPSNMLRTTQLSSSQVTAFKGHSRGRGAQCQVQNICTQTPRAGPAVRPSEKCGLN